MRTLGFSVGHDKGAVIIEDGKVVVGITQERLSRIKHDGAYSGGKIPFESINYCLNALGLTLEDIDSYFRRIQHHYIHMLYSGFFQQ